MKKVTIQFGICLLWLFLGSLPMLGSVDRTPPRILFVGDSLTAGYQLGKEFAFPALLQSRLLERGTPVDIINAGISGDTSAGGLARMDWLLKRPPDILVLGLGANDALRGIPPGETLSNLSRIIEKARTANPEMGILLLGMLAPPNMGEDYQTSFAAIFQTLAADEHHISLVPFFLEGVAGNPDLNLGDGIHPNAEGHRKIASLLLPHLQNLLQKKESEN